MRLRNIVLLGIVFFSFLFFNRIKEKIEKAVSILEGKSFLINRTLHKDYYNMLSMFDKLEVKKLAFYKN